jgi:hypothetical protein
MVTVYTTRGTNIPHVSVHYMFRPDEAIFRYIGVLQSPVSLSATCATNCTDGNHNTALSFTQYDAEVQHF